MNKEELRETRKQMLPLVTAFSPRDSLSKLSSPLGFPKVFAQMEQRLQEMHPKEEDRMFYYHSSEDRIVLLHALFWVMTSFRNPTSPLSYARIPSRLGIA